MGEGFDRFSRLPVPTERREFDAEAGVDKLLQWVRRDTTTGGGESLFYFCHIGDAHYPYYRTLPNTGEDSDGQALRAFRTGARDRSTYTERASMRNPDSPPHVGLAKEHYEQAVESVGKQLKRFVNSLRTLGILDDSLIIITGDHGEEFFERGFGLQFTLYDNNIRPGMIVKPPADSSLQVPDVTDLIDIYPTIARLVSADIPPEVDGVPWQERPATDRPRFSERYATDSYSLAVEHDGVKSIYTFDALPSEHDDVSSLLERRVLTERYVMDHVRSGNYAKSAEEAGKRETALADELLRNFLRSVDSTEPVEQTTVSEDVVDRLEKLGYT